MAIDIWSLWATPQGTPDLLGVPYDSEFANDLLGLNLPDSDTMVMVDREAIIELADKWKEEPEIQRVIGIWLQQMDDHDQDFIRLTLNY